jgi:Zn-dependent protease/CBS domain-containing protein
MFGTHAWRLGRFGGVEIKIDPSWSFIAFLVGYTFFLVLDDAFPDREQGLLIGVAAVMAIVFFASVLLHELAHSWTAMARGIEVRGITLFLFGGATHADLDAEQPGDELVIASAGPVTSLAIAGILWAVAELVGDTLLGYAAGRLGWINLVLAVFNLVPGFPLDGGRILRSLVWRRSGNLLKATHISAATGQGFGYVLIGLGILEIMFAGALIGGLWFIAIGWFLSQSAQAAFIQLRVKHMLADVPARRVMTSGLIEIPADLNVQKAIDEYFMRHAHSAYPVRDGDTIIGIITLPVVRGVPHDDRPDRRVGDVAVPLSDACTVGPSDPMDDVLEKLNTNDTHRVVVVADGRVAGMITTRNLTRWLQRSEELGLDEVEIPS